MRFGNNFKINDIPEEQPVRMPCGAFNGMPATGLYPMQQQQHLVPSQQVMPPLPTGYPTGGTATPLLPVQNGATPMAAGEQLPATVQSTLFTPGFLKTQIGKRMRIEFLIGTGALIDRTGTLIGVGASYVLIRMVDSDDVMMCDIYSIKFATIFY